MLDISVRINDLFMFVNGLQLATVKWHRCLLATTLIISLFHFYNFICIFIPKECSTYFALFICHIAFLFNQHVITCKIFLCGDIRTKEC